VAEKKRERASAHQFGKGEQWKDIQKEEERKRKKSGRRASLVSAQKKTAVLKVSRNKGEKRKGDGYVNLS